MHEGQNEPTANLCFSPGATNAPHITMMRCSRVRMSELQRRCTQPHLWNDVGGGGGGDSKHQ